jgi:hypothetical protein
MNRNFLDRIPFLPKEQGKRELVGFLTLAFGIMLAGLIAAQLGWLYKDVPSSGDATPTVLVTETPLATELPGIVATPDAD